MEAKRVADNIIPPEEIDLALPHKTFIVYTYFGSIRDS